MLNKSQKRQAQAAADTQGSHAHERPLKAIRLPAVLEKTGHSRSTWYRLIQEGKAPPPFKISARASAWFEHEIDAYLSDLPKNAGNIYKEARKLLDGKA